MPINNYLSILKESRLKITPRRKAVIKLFLDKGRYLGPYEIRDMLKKISLKAGLPSVYRILQELEKAGILVKVEHKNRQLYYSLCKNPHEDHHHFICRKCNKVEEVKFCNFQEISRFIEKKLKGHVERHSLHIEGLCSVCR
ncbi:MAG: Fur family transcriptional regulator [Candidatus Omnitrophota bacterium]